MKLLILDNYDSFTYNVVHAVRHHGVEPDVFRNDEISLDEIERYDAIIISPGPGIPSEAGILPQLLKRYSPTKRIFGICLGEQAIGECFGAKLRNLDEVWHGLQTPTSIVANDYIFNGLGPEIQVGRYHSWVVDKCGFPESLEITALSPDGEIMALRHRNYDVRGVQFHPESILTPQGLIILKNWLQGPQL